MGAVRKMRGCAPGLAGASAGVAFAGERWHAPAVNHSARSSCRSLAVALAAAMVFTSVSAPASAAFEPASAEDSASGSEGGAATSRVPLSDDPALEYKLGTQAYALGNYEQAIAHFERSYALSNHPYLLYNLGLAYTQWHGLSNDVGHLRKAKRLFQNYLKALAEDPQMDQEQREDAEAQIAKLDEQIAESEARDATTATPTTPTTKAEGPRDDDARSPHGGDQPPPVKQPVYKRGWFWGVLTVGVLAVAGGVTAGVLASRRDSKGPELGSIGPTHGSAPTGFGLRF